MVGFVSNEGQIAKSFTFTFSPKKLKNGKIYFDVKKDLLTLSNIDGKNLKIIDVTGKIILNEKNRKRKKSI